MIRSNPDAWIQTYTGKMLWPLEPAAEDVFLLDIAHALSMKCRYGGHCAEFYSVAEHCVLLSHVVSKPNALWALLHDAAEAYLADIPRPVKPFIGGFKDLETEIMVQVCAKFGLDPEEPEEVKAADTRITADEKLALMQAGPAWNGLGTPFGVRINNYRPRLARKFFVQRFLELQKR